MEVSDPSRTVTRGPVTWTRSCWALNTSSSWIVNRPAYLPACTTSVTTAACPGLAPRLKPPNWLKSPVSKSALNRTSAAAGLSQTRPPDSRTAAANSPCRVIGLMRAPLGPLNPYGYPAPASHGNAVTATGGRHLVWQGKLGGPWATPLTSVWPPVGTDSAADRQQ